MKRYYPRIRVRRNSAGNFDAYLVKAAFTTEVYVSTGPTIAGALWWVPAPMPARCCSITSNERP